jgi:hypothetical protein
VPVSENYLPQVSGRNKKYRPILKRQNNFTERGSKTSVIGSGIAAGGIFYNWSGRQGHLSPGLSQNRA